MRICNCEDEMGKEWEKGNKRKGKGKKNIDGRRGDGR
jgi:hypothetical protein